MYEKNKPNVTKGNTSPTKGTKIVGRKDADIEVKEVSFP
jgi:hypothetical protein